MAVSQSAIAEVHDYSMSKKDLLTIVIASLALGLSIFNAWDAHWRGPDTRISFGPYAYFIGADIIGINCSFWNEGSEQDTVSFMTAEIKGENETLRSIWSTVTAHQWVLQEQRKEKSTHETEFTDFTPVVVPSKGRDSRVVWFTSDTKYKFQAREYQIAVRGYGSDLHQIRTETSLTIVLSEDQKKRIEESPDLEVAVRLKPWIGNPR